MSVEHITYKKKRLPVKLGYYALKMLHKEHSATIDQVQSDISLYEPLLYYSLVQGHKVEKKDLELTLEDMEEVLDDCFFEFVALIPKFFPELEKMMGEGGTLTKK